MKAVASLMLRPGSWICAAACGLFAIELAMVGGGALRPLLGAVLAFAGLSTLAGLGQMVVIAAGNGNIDLSIPAVMTLAAYLAMGQMHDNDQGLWLGLVLGLFTGAAAGMANALLVLVLRIPPMIATLACGFVAQSLAIAYSRGSTAAPAPGLASFVTASLAGIPAVAWIAALLSAWLSIEFAYGVFGRCVEAIGQNSRAARFAALRVESTLFGAYLLCGLMAAVAGMLYAAYSGGASLGMAQDFMLVSIAVVVIGGSNVAGGQASVLGVFGASAFLFLTSTTLNTLRFGPGNRSIITGAIIIAVLAFFSRKPAR